MIDFRSDPNRVKFAYRLTADPSTAVPTKFVPNKNRKVRRPKLALSKMI